LGIHARIGAFRHRVAGGHCDRGFDDVGNACRIGRRRDACRALSSTERRGFGVQLLFQGSRFA
jgi:hypothetical protein